MQQKQNAFTLIELLVVIVIIGILATVSTATFSGNLAKARDAQRVTAVNQMAKLIESNGVGRDYYDWGGNGTNIYEDDEAKYTYTDVDLKTLFTENGYELPPAENNICYLFSLVGANNSDRKAAFSVTTWGETTSTANPGTPGLIFAGTPEMVNNLTLGSNATYPISSGGIIMETPSIEDFQCDDFDDNRSMNAYAFGGTPVSYPKINALATGSSAFSTLSGIELVSFNGANLQITNTVNQELCLTHALPGYPCH